MAPLTAQDLENLLRSATLLTLSGTSEVRLLVLQNQEYRLLVLNGALQSVIDMGQPERLIFPHQTHLLAPLKTLHDGADVLELGLGGGSAMAYARANFPTLQWTCLENSAEVISLYMDYFAPEIFVPHHQILFADALQWLRETPAEQQYDLVLCDLYDRVQQPLIDLCAARVRPGGILMVNWLPHLNAEGGGEQLFMTHPMVRSWQRQVTPVPGFRNLVYQLAKPIK